MNNNIFEEKEKKKLKKIGLAGLATGVLLYILIHYILPLFY